MNNLMLFQAEKSWFSSDWHLFHSNVISFDNRPFSSIEEMNKTIIDNHKHLKEDDCLFFLGDLTFERGFKQTTNYLYSLQCKMYLIRGNHDKTWNWSQSLKDRFEWINDFKEITVIEQGPPLVRRSITLCHYALKTWSKSHHGSWSLYGHSHGSLPDDNKSHSLDVGINCHNYSPLSYQQIKDKMATKNWVAIDHHR